MAQSRDELLDRFVVESRERMSEAERELLALESTSASEPEAINRIFRAVHSVKGAAGFFGLTNINSLSHELENVLNLVRTGELSPASGLTDVMLGACDQLTSLLDDVRASNDTDVTALVDALKAAASRPAGIPSAPAIPTPGPTAAASQNSQATAFQPSQAQLQRAKECGYHLYQVNFDLLAPPWHASLTELAAKVASIGELFDSRLDAAAVGTLDSAPPQHLNFSALLATVLEPALLTGFFEHAADKPRHLATPQGPQVADETSPVASDKPAAPSAASNAAPAPARSPAPTAPPPKAPASTLRVPVNVLDRLMTLAGELVLSRNRLVQLIADQRGSLLSQIGSGIDRITTELQDAVMKSRMQPVDTEFSKFPRVVRDLSRKLGKQCELTIVGREVELDKTVIEALGDPLTHLIRNAVDHGLETPGLRQKAGKKPAGRIHLSATHRAGKVSIEISDDGRGIDPAVIRSKAVAKGVISQEQAAQLSTRESLELIFAAGFSTAEKVTDVSGRGVGMDVVRSNIERIGGVVEIDSTPGNGTTIRLLLPLTLAIMPALIVRCGERRFAIPQSQIRELVGIEREKLSSRLRGINGSLVLKLRDSLLPLVQPHDALGTPAPEEAHEDESAVMTSIVVLETGTLAFGLMVDALYDSTEIVVRPLGQHLRGLPCLSGATILGDGTVAMILDAGSVASELKLTQPVHEEAATLETKAATESETLLLFTHHPDEVFGIPMSLVARVEKADRTRIRRVGKRLVLQHAAEALPLLRIEEQIDARPAPESDELRIVVLNLGHRRVGLPVGCLDDSHVLTEPVDTQSIREPGVLGTAVINSRTIRLLDVFAMAQGAYPEWFRSAPPPSGAPRRVLLAEDSEFFRKQIEAYLLSSGFQVVTCLDGQDAAERLDEPDARFDLIVSDIEMPRMNGLELARHVRAHPRWSSIPLLAVTSLSNESQVKAGIDAGFDRYLVKLRREELLEAISQVVSPRPIPLATGQEIPS